ncbi:ABC transporter permease [Streptomyces sp. NPDC005494]|uniref:ABC transporter permease n=1 Tax=Streptomyces sp. NPDC005494 TaxID=3364715 RepID=UPI0036942533
MLAIALSELIQIFRNRLALITSFIMPVAVCAFFIRQHEQFAALGSLGYIAAVVIFTVGVFGLYTGTVTTLAARRQNLFLKRLRSTAADDVGILCGLLLPITLIVLVQIVAILCVLAVVTGAPADILLLGAAVLLSLVMMLGLGLATAGLTNSPEQAQITTLPVSLGVIAVVSWVGIAGTEDLTLLKRLLPGGAATELVGNAWHGGVAVADSLPLFAPMLGWIVVAVALASRLFRWEPRR